MYGDQQQIGEILLAKGYITEDELAHAQQYQQEKGLKIGEAIVKLKYASQKQVTEALAEQFGLPFADLDDMEIDPEVIAAVPKNVVTEHSLCPIQRKKRTLVVAVADPLDFFALDNLRFILNTEVECALATPQALSQAIAKYYGEVGAIDQMIDDLTSSEIKIGHEDLAEMEVEDEDDDAPVIRLVNLIIANGIKNRASDIHMEPMAKKFRVRYRIDGVCVEAEPPPKKLQASIISRVKVMAGLQLEEKRRPQDGRIKMAVQSREIDLRVSVMPTTHGETIVMRILDKQKALVSLDKLGFFAQDMQAFYRIIKRPNGIFLVTGPTGSGKTTTLYAALLELNRTDVKIITAENPIEYNIPGINQCEVRHKIGLDFQRILRAMLRQAPNIILVGEIRDRETADIAIQAALTGHLVFSTLHTNDAPSAITRLIDMGVKPFLVSSAVVAVLAQRLIRLLCEHCKEAYEPEPHLLHAIGLDPDVAAQSTIYRPVGCEECEGKGYRGRVGAYELMEMNVELRELAFRKRPTNEIRECAIRSGMTTLQQDAVRKILAGRTTIDEVLRITHAQDLEAQTSSSAS